MVEADQVSSDITEDGIVRARLSSYFPRRPIRQTQPDPEHQRGHDRNPRNDRAPEAVAGPAPLPDDPSHGDFADVDGEMDSLPIAADVPVPDEPVAEAARTPRQAVFDVRPVPPKFAPSHPQFEIPPEPAPEPYPEPVAAPVPPANAPSNDQTPTARRRPISEETLASIVAGRTFDNDEAERAFLLTLSRDQRLKYAELLHADEQLELDVQRHNFRLDQLDFERERLIAGERTRRSENAFTFANQAIRILLVLNGLGAIVVLGVWGYLAAAPGARFVGSDFEQAVWALGLGAVATVLTAVSSYVTQALMAIDDGSRMWYRLIVGARGLGVFLAGAGFLAFLIGLSLASYGLSTG